MVSVPPLYYVHLSSNTAEKSKVVFCAILIKKNEIKQKRQGLAKLTPDIGNLNTNAAMKLK